MNETLSKQEAIHATASLLVDELVTALVNSRIYHLEHPRLQASLARVVELVEELTDLSATDRVRIACSESMLFFQGKPLVGASIAAARLLEAVAGWRSGGLELMRQTTTEELAVFFACFLGNKQRPDETAADLNDRATSRRCIHVRLLPRATSEKLVSNDETEVVQAYQRHVDYLQNVTVSLCSGGTIDFAPILSSAEEILNRLESNDTRLLGLLRQEQYDAFTFGHSIRVAILAMHFTRHLTDNREVQLRVGAAALLHDVGKSLIPFEILHSTKPLSDEERREMSRHPELGARCLLDHHDSDPLAVAAAFGHHMAPDGTGYPETVHEHPISWVVSIVTICDIFEALTAARPYKNAMTPVRAYRVMLAMGDKLDRGLLRRFIELNGIYPIGQHVRLATGEIAQVRQQTDDPQHPIVSMLADSDGAALEDGELFDLREIACPGARIILSELGNARAPEHAGED